LKLQVAAANPSPAVRITAAFLMAAIGYLCVTLLVYFSALLLLQKGVALDIPWIRPVQENLYHGGIRRIWQNQPDCVEFDPELVYRPREGKCRFRNAEFDTEMTFAARERVHGPRLAGTTGVAVLGDSHAMGWGVGDHETFSAHLQARLGRTVHNLGVSSYGTARELLALERAGILYSVDTVFIQYSENDVDENRAFSPPAARGGEQIFATVTQAPPRTLRESLPFLFAGLRYAIKVPFGAIKQWWRGERTLDFAPHYAPLIERLAAHPALKDKRVVVFYINPFGQRFRNFPAGRDSSLPHVEFVNLAVGPGNYFLLDGHPTPAGHREIASRLAGLFASRP